MIYKIENKNEKTWNDKKFTEAELVDSQGERFKVSAWAGEFEGKEEIECTLEKNDKGYWKLLTPKKVAGANFKATQINETMQRKETSIKGFQDSKEWSIMTASSMNKAIDLAIAEIKDIKTLNTLEQDILKWREWIINNWEIEPTAKKPF